MFEWMPFWPATAAESGQVVNALFIAELVLSVVIVLTVAVLMLNFVVRYHHGSGASRAHRVHATWRYEIAWTSATLVAFLVLFVFGAHYYIWLYKSPAADIEIFVVGKQWMWKVQHPGGQREIDEVHVPVGKVVRLVIAVAGCRCTAFSFPPSASSATRCPAPIIPCGSRRQRPAPTASNAPSSAAPSTSKWPARSSRWSRPPIPIGWRSGEPAKRWRSRGKRLFRELGCSGCHSAASTVHAPSLVGLYGRLVHLMDGTTVVADRQYVMDSILLPKKQIVAGYPPVMPSFAGQIGEEDLIKLIAYIKSLSPGTR